jgi:L-rhamnose mutarotase
MSARHCLVLDLKDDPELIAQYEVHHRQVWPEVLAHIRAAGVEEMTIWRHGTRLVMLLEAGPDFSFARMAALEVETPRVQAWEKLMWAFQQALPGAPAGSKWQIAAPIFKLSEA